MGLDIPFLIAIGVGMLYALIMAFLSWHQTQWVVRRKQDNVQDTTPRPPVSILKPLKGVDDDLEMNLRSFFALDYPEYELIFGVQDAADPALALVEKLQSEFPEVPVHLVRDHSRIGLNPKVNNLNNMYPYARHKHLLISDSNVLVRPDYLEQMMAALREEDVGLVASTIRGVGARSVGSMMENLHLNSYIAGSVFAAEHLADLPVIIGKSMLFERRTLELIGGLPAFRDLLAEDYLIGEAIADLGMKITTIPHSIDNVNRSWSMLRFLNRHTRWAKLRRFINPPVFFGELFVNPIAMSFVYGLLRFDLPGLGQFLSVCAAKIFVETLQMRYFMKSDMRLWQYLLIPVKDLLIAGIWFVPFVNRRVMWRGNTFRITTKTKLLPVTQHS